MKKWGEKSFGVSNLSSLPAADIMRIFSWIVIDPMNYDIAPGKSQLYSMVTDKAESQRRMGSLSAAPCALQLYRFEAECLLCLGI